MAPTDRDESDAEQLRDARDPLLGSSVGRFRVERVLGQGGMGAVYELVHPGIQKRMAMKVLHEDYADRKDVVQRFFDEARAVNLIGHPNIVDISDFGHLDDGRPFIIMEYLEGRTLEGYLLEEGALSEDRALALFDQLAGALQAAHEAGVVHRDLKPENIFLVEVADREPQLKILDFGIAKLKGEHRGDDLTETGMVLGTPTYMSPEQASGKSRESDARSDVYSLGILLYEMVAGAPPFKGESIPELILKHLNQPPPPLKGPEGQSMPRLAPVVERALAKAPALRFATIRAMREALDVEPAAAVRARQPPLDETLPGGTQPPTRVSSSAELVAAADPGTMSYGADELRVVANEPSHPGSHLLRNTLLAASVAVLGLAGFLLLRRPGTDETPSTATPATAETPPSLAATVASVDAEPIALPPVDAGAIDDAAPAEGPSDPAVDKGVRPAALPARAARGRGTLKVLASPWAQVFVDGKHRGQTPLELELTAGKHRLRLYNEDRDESRRRRIEILKGKTLEVRERWQ